MAKSMDKNSASAFRLRERLSRRDEKFSISLSPEALSGNCIKKRLQNSPPLIFCRVFFVYRRSPAYMEIPSGFSLGHIFALQEIWKLITSSTSRHILRGVYLKRARNMSLGVQLYHFRVCMEKSV